MTTVRETAPATPALGPNLARRAALASVTVATALLGIKGYAAYRTGSVAMLASLADTALDLFASLVTLLAVWFAARPADHDHRFGHGKAEALAALFQVMLIAASALGVAIRAVHRFLHHETTSDAGFGIGASSVAVVVTIALVAYQRRVIRQTGSVAINADRVHYEADLALNLAVIASLALDQYLGLGGADPVFGVAIALWLLFGAWRASSEAIDQLMDKEWPEDKRLRFVEVASHHPELIGMHDLRTRTSGTRDFVQFHMWMDPDLTVAQAHDIVDEIEHRLLAEFPGTDILIHIDPEGKVDHPGNHLVETDLTASLKEPS